MNTGIVNIIRVAAALLVLSGCSTAPVQPLGDKYEEPIMSAADVKSMIRVEVRTLEPISAEQTILASTD